MRNINMVSLAGLVLIVAGIAALTLAPASMASGKGILSVKVYSIDSVMTAVYKVYGNERLGYWVAKTIIRNEGEGPLYDVRVSYKIEGLTDWSEPHVYKLIVPGGAVVDLYYPIITVPPNIQTSTPSTLYVKIEYKNMPKGESEVETVSRPITLLGSHDFVFSGIPPEENTGSFRDMLSNYELLAAWVTPKDPVVERYADMANKLAGGAGAALDVQQALSFLEALWDFSVYNGITYQTEPQAFWTGKQAQWVKYPRDVIRDRSGTCLDTSLFFASLAMAHGLRAYIVIIPGHAFPIIELPDGQLLPVETTMLNNGVSFMEAVQAGIQEAQQAFMGPHLLVDVQTLQAKGITPPELPELPPNVLEQWGYTLPTMGGGNQMQGGGGGQAGEGYGQGTGGAGGESGADSGGAMSGGVERLTNPLGDIPWTIMIPSGWIVETYDGDPYEVDISSPDYSALIMIVWSYQYSSIELRAAFEDMLASYGDYSITGENPDGAIGSIPAYTVVYQTSYGEFIAARFADLNGVSLAVIYILDSTVATQENIMYMEDLVSTFTIG